MAADYEKGMIDLGTDMKDVVEMKSNPMDQTSYPSMSIRDNYELDDLPDGEFYAICKLKVTRHTEEDPVEGDGGCSCEIAVLGMKPLDVAPKTKPKDKNADDALDETLTKMEQDKANGESE